MIVLFTDFGNAGPYVGQMKAVLYRDCPGVLIVDLVADAPAHNPRAAAYLLAALAPEFPAGSVFLGVVDPGVGDPARRPAAVAVDGQWFVGPDNGLFNVVAARGDTVQWWDIDWRPPRLSASFHGRDLFAPLAARIARGEAPPGINFPAADRILPGWPQDLAEIVYIDGFGNVMSGVRAAQLAATARVRLRDRDIVHARTFAAVPVGQLFWYENANGLLEIAVNQGSAAQLLGAAIGDTLHIV